MMTDSSAHTEGTTEYECLGCGAIVRREQHPVQCDECGGDFHERSVPRE